MLPVPAALRPHRGCGPLWASGHPPLRTALHLRQALCRSQVEDSGKETAGAAGEEARGCGEVGWRDGAEAVRREGPGRHMVSEEGCSGGPDHSELQHSHLGPCMGGAAVGVLNGGEMMGDIQRQARLLQGVPKSCWRRLFASGGGD